MLSKLNKIFTNFIYSKWSWSSDGWESTFFGRSADKRWSADLPKKGFRWEPTFFDRSADKRWSADLPKKGSRWESTFFGRSADKWWLVDLPKKGSRWERVRRTARPLSKHVFGRELKLALELVVWGSHFLRTGSKPVWFSDDWRDF